MKAATKFTIVKCLLFPIAAVWEGFIANDLWGEIITPIFGLPAPGLWLVAALITAVAGFLHGAEMFTIAVEVMRPDKKITEDQADEEKSLAMEHNALLASERFAAWTFVAFCFPLYVWCICNAYLFFGG